MARLRFTGGHGATWHCLEPWRAGPRWSWFLLWATCQVGTHHYWAVITSNFCLTTEGQSLVFSVHNRMSSCGNSEEESNSTGSFGSQVRGEKGTRAHRQGEEGSLEGTTRCRKFPRKWKDCVTTEPLSHPGPARSLTGWSRGSGTRPQADSSKGVGQACACAPPPGAPRLGAGRRGGDPDRDTPLTRGRRGPERQAGHRQRGAGRRGAAECAFVSAVLELVLAGPTDCAPGSAPAQCIPGEAGVLLERARGLSQACVALLKAEEEEDPFSKDWSPCQDPLRWL